MIAVTDVPRANSADDRGRRAQSPWAIPVSGWKDILTRTWAESGEDNLGLVAAGVSFYGFLALVPLLGALVLSYGLVADPQTIVAHLEGLTSIMPADAAKLVGEQLLNVVQTSGGKKGFGLLLALALALFGARNGAASLITALNIVYEQKETRSFIRLNLIALAITGAAVVIGLFALVAIAALGHLETLFPGAPAAILLLGKALSYALVGLGGAAGAATLYRYGPDRAKAKWVWLTPGSVLAAILWLILTIGFGIYVANFGNYDATYGSLGTVIVILTWFYLSSYVFLIGAEINSELEHQTEHDTTTGPEQPLGARNAKMADAVASQDPAPPELETPRPGTAQAAEPTERAHQNRTVLADYATSRVAGRSAGVLGLERVGALPSLLCTGGLAMLRRRGRAKAGIALLVAGGLVAWLSEEGDEASR